MALSWSSRCCSGCGHALSCLVAVKSASLSRLQSAPVYTDMRRQVWQAHKLIKRMNQIKEGRGSLEEKKKENWVQSVLVNYLLWIYNAKRVHQPECRMKE